MKAALIGNGFIGKAHRHNGFYVLKKENSDIELVAICDVRPEMLKDNDGERLYTSVDEMLAKEKDLDFVCVCLPTYLHAEYAIKCMRAGLHVFCEKPMALTFEDAQKMLDCSRETGKRLMIGQISRFSSERQIIKKFVEEGRFGKPVSAFFVSSDGQPTWGFENWFADGKRSGGAMLDLQAHNIDLINWYFGMPKYTSTVAKECAPGFTGYGSVSANMVYEGGMFVHSWCDWGVPGNKHDRRVNRINFEKGYIIFKTGGGIDPFLLTVDNEGNETDLLGTVTVPTPSFRYEEEYFVRCIEQGVPFDICPPEESAKVIKIMRAQEKSADQCGAPVEIV